MAMSAAPAMTLHAIHFRDRHDPVVLPYVLHGGPPSAEATAFPTPSPRRVDANLGLSSSHVNDT